MRLLNTAGGGVTAFIRRAEYETAHAYPKPKGSGRTGSKGYIKWFWSSHSLSLIVWLASGKVELWHPKLIGGCYRTTAARDTKEVVGVFYMLFDLLGNDDQTFRILTEPYKGP